MTTEETPLLRNENDTVHDRFSSRRKKVLLTIVSLGSLVTFFTSGTFIPTIPLIVKELNSTEGMISFAVSLYMLANAAGSLIAARYSSFSKDGRRPIYLCWFPLMIIGSIGVANSQSVTSLMIWRVIQGTGASPGLSVGAGVIGDIYRLEERGTALGIYLCTGLLGYALAPTIGGVTAYYLSWRAVHYIIATFTFATLISIVFFFPETKRPGTRGIDEQQRAGIASSRLWPVMLNPLKQLSVLRSPNILAASFLNYTGLLTDFALLIPLPYTIGKRYGIDNEALLGACFLPLGFGKAVGAPLAGWISDKVVSTYKKKRGYWYPEDRLRASLFSSFSPLCVLGSGITTKYVPGTLGLVLNLVCLFFSGVACDLALTPAGAYVVDVLHSKSAEATASVNTFRMIATAASSAILLPMVNAYGYLFMTLVVALVAISGIGVTILTIANGEAMRKWVDVGFSTAGNN
ncbi:hypothetical protein NP233_g2933 [Leucocoprinus birnbaumii]|uniref:Major facilitator superfamily (MFS) profile domain-containing protein n=1 Tax=Leucocoprinus birnbaumii TaxID=56174 RepID=A0AAD5VZA0_9AGAR|nr:hypothetical protein NP233_g2933 [Leucocoprinus birnbaumii]